MAITPEALDALSHDFEEYIQATNKVMNNRATLLSAVTAVIDPKISEADVKVNEAKRVLTAKEKLTRQSWFPAAGAGAAPKIEYDIAKTQSDFLFNIYNKLSRAKQLIQNLERDDQIRLLEVRDLEANIKKEWSELNEKCKDNIAFDESDEVKFQNLQKKLIQLQRLKEEILRHEEKIAHCRQFAEKYDPDHPENIYDHLLEYANVIFEEKDHYDFVGKIEYQDIENHRSKPSGLIAYSQARGEILKSHEVVRYTHPGFTKIVIEQDSRGRIMNKTDPNVEEGRVESALKIASLLLMDMQKKGKHTVSIQGSPPYRNMAVLLVAAVLFEAQEAGITLSLENIKVDMPDWDPAKEKAQIENYKQALPQYHTHYQTKDELKQKLQHIRNGGEDILNVEPLIAPHKRGPTI